MAWNWLADRLVPILDVLAEAAWVAVVAAAIDIGLGQATTSWGPLPFTVAAAAGLIWIRRLNDPGVTAVGLFGLMVAFGVGGAALQAGLLSGASVSVDVLLHQSALLMMPVAVLRGSRHRQSDDDDLVMSNLLTWGIPLLALPWILGTSVPEPLRSDFIAAAFPSTVLFVVAGLLGLGLARLEALSATAPVHWRQNRSWLILLGGVVVAVTVVAIPAAFLIGTPLAQITAGLLTPLAIVLAPVGAVLAAVFVILFAWLDPLVNWIKSISHPPQQQPDPGQGGVGPTTPPGPPVPPPTHDNTVVLAVAILIAIAVVVVVIVWLSRKRRMPDPGPTLSVLEEHHFKFAGTGWHLPTLRRAGPRRRGRPATASGAYLSYLDDLTDSDDLARQPFEGPASHAGRLRQTAPDWPAAAGLLAADYQLEQYAGRTLSPAETQRAIERWQRMRALAKGRDKGEPKRDKPKRDKPKS